MWNQSVERPIILLDGGMGTELRARGVEVPDHTTSIWSAKALRADPDAIVGVHRDYIAAGAEVITINNYMLTPPLLEREGWSDQLEDLTLLAVDLAERARDASGTRVRIAGSLPPLHTSYRADMVGEDDANLAMYRTIAGILASRVDILLCETMASGREAVAAAIAATETGRETWLSWTMQGRTPDRLPSGESLPEAFAAVEQLPISAYLVNCCAANFVTRAMPVLRELTDKPFGGYANGVNFDIEAAGPPQPADAADSWDDSAWKRLDPRDYAAEVGQWLDAGATLVGGCCGTRPAHIAELRSGLLGRAA